MQAPTVPFLVGVALLAPLPGRGRVSAQQDVFNARKPYQCANQLFGKSGDALIGTALAEHDVKVLEHAVIKVLAFADNPAMVWPQYQDQNPKLGRQPHQ